MKGHNCQLSHDRSSADGFPRGSGSRVQALDPSSLRTQRTSIKLAWLATASGVFVIFDEIHAPLAHPDETLVPFAPLAHPDETLVPFAPLAATAGALAVTTTSASKGWNLAGAPETQGTAVDRIAAIAPPREGSR